MDWEYEFKTRIINYIHKGYKKFIVAPYGKLGKKVVDNLERIGGVESIKTYDNYKDGFQNIGEIKHIYEDEIVLLALSNSKQQVEEELYKNVEKEKVIDLFPDYGFISKHLRETFYKEHLFEFIYNGIEVKFELPHIGEDLIENHIAWFRNFFEEELLYYIFYVWEEGQIRSYLKDKAVLDIGANLGNHTVYFSKICGVKSVYAFEPNAVAFNMLNKNIEINDLVETVKAFNIGVGHKRSKGEITFFDSQNIGRTQIAEKEDGQIEILPIDDFDFGTKIGLIKIDVEGMEVDVIRGAVNTIQKDKPYIMLESWNTTENIKCIRDILQPIGYCEKQISETDYLFFHNFLGGINEAG